MQPSSSNWPKNRSPSLATSTWALSAPALGSRMVSIPGDGVARRVGAAVAVDEGLHRRPQRDVVVALEREGELVGVVEVVRDHRAVEVAGAAGGEAIPGQLAGVVARGQAQRRGAAVDAGRGAGLGPDVGQLLADRGQDLGLDVGDDLDVGHADRRGQVAEGDRRVRVGVEAAAVGEEREDADRRRDQDVHGAVAVEVAEHRVRGRRPDGLGGRGEQVSVGVAEPDLELAVADPDQIGIAVAVDVPGGDVERVERVGPGGRRERRRRRPAPAVGAAGVAVGAGLALVADEVAGEVAGGPAGAGGGGAVALLAVVGLDHAVAADAPGDAGQVGAGRRGEGHGGDQQGSRHGSPRPAARGKLVDVAPAHRRLSGRMDPRFESRPPPDRWLTSAGGAGAACGGGARPSCGARPPRWCRRRRARSPTG